MELQLAIDRVSVEEAINLISQVHGRADIIEIGTSLIKEYGLYGSVQKIKRLFPDQTFLADLKTADEGEYEFRTAFKAGADIATVMGYASDETISACGNVAHEFHKEYMIDLLQVPSFRIKQLKVFQDAIFCIHLPSDDKKGNLKKLIEETSKSISGKRRIAVAGGVTSQMMGFLKAAGCEIAIVGSAITKSGDIRHAVDSFYKEISKEA